MANELDAIMAALTGGGGGGDRFFESPRTIAEAAEVADVARQQQQQRSQLDFLTGLLEAQTTQQIRGKQETDPLARAVELLRTGQTQPTVGTVNGRPKVEPARGKGELDNILALIAAQHPRTTTAGPDRLTAALGQMGDIRKSLDPLITEFMTLRPGDARRKEILGQAELIFRNASALARGVDMIAPGFGTTFILQPLQEQFATLGMIEPTPKAGGAPAAGGPQAAPTPAPQPKARRPEEQQLSEGLARLLADLLGLGAGAGSEFVTP